MRTDLPLPPVPQDWNPAARLLSAREAAASLCRPHATVRRWIAEGRLHAQWVRGGELMFLEADVLEAEAATRAAQPGAAARRRALSAAVALVPPDAPLGFGDDR